MITTICTLTRANRMCLDTFPTLRHSRDAVLLLRGWSRVRWLDSNLPIHPNEFSETEHIYGTNVIRSERYHIQKGLLVPSGHSDNHCLDFYHCMLLSFDHCLNWFILCTFFCVWLISYNIMFLRFISIVSLSGYHLRNG